MPSPNGAGWCRQPRFDYELIRIESGHLDYSRTFFAYPIKSR
jgi:hypothetical protein